MKIVADNAIPFLKGVLEPYARVEYLPGKTIATADVRDADALIVRTRTRCDAALLEGSSVKLIATATIGFDHIDTEYCRRHGIEVATAAGCNARGVLQYVAAALVRLSRVQAWEPADKTLGIVGVGHVGSLVEAYARTWGFRVVACDPPREEREHGGFLPLEEVACQADILTFHTPLDDTTRHMAGAKLFERMKPGSILINTSRGEVVDGPLVLGCRVAGRDGLEAPREGVTRRSVESARRQEGPGDGAQGVGRDVSAGDEVGGAAYEIVGAVAPVGEK